jgi:hypothetical protein
MLYTLYHREFFTYTFEELTGVAGLKIPDNVTLMFGVGFEDDDYAKLLYKWGRHFYVVEGACLRTTITRHTRSLKKALSWMII